MVDRLFLSVIINHFAIRSITEIRRKLLNFCEINKLITDRKITSWNFDDYGAVNATVSAEFIFDYGDFTIRFRQNEFVTGNDPTLYVIGEFRYTPESFKQQHIKITALIQEMIDVELNSELKDAKVWLRYGNHKFEYYLTVKESVCIPSNVESLDEALSFIYLIHDIYYYRRWLNDPTTTLFINNPKRIFEISLSINKCNIILKYFAHEDFKIGLDLVHKCIARMKLNERKVDINIEWNSHIINPRNTTLDDYTGLF